MNRYAEKVLTSVTGELRGKIKITGWIGISSEQTN
jgi:hypothetical protein